MRLQALIHHERVAFESGKLAGKRATLKALCRLLAAADVGVGFEAVLAAVEAREQVQSTGMGAGVAVPHAVVAGCQSPAAALLLLRQPVPFDAVDNKPVNILFGLIGPPSSSVQHLRALARVSRVLRELSFRTRLLEASTAAEAYRLFCERDGMLR